MASNSNVKVSFIAKVELIKLHPQHPGKQIGSKWTPPTDAAAFTRGGQPRLFRWHDGSMQPFSGQCPENNQRYHAATVFTEGQSRALLSVMRDARAQSVTAAGGWRSLHFEAAPAALTLSRVGTEFKNETLRSPGGQDWVGQLLPSCNHCQASLTDAITGLTGELPILIALAALSTSESKIEYVLGKSIRGHKWEPHKYTQGRLRDEIKQGIVVTIYLDPTNPHGSTKKYLEKLEIGEYGGFYRA